MTQQFTDNTAKNRFEYHVDNAVVVANYRIKDTTLYIDYVEAPQELRGSGAAGKLMQHVVDHARENKQKIWPICGYAALWLQRHPETADIQA